MRGNVNPAGMTCMVSRAAVKNKDDMGTQRPA